MLAPYLSDLGAADFDAGGHIFGDDAEAHDFGSEQAAQAWLHAHPDCAGSVVQAAPTERDAEIARLAQALEGERHMRKRAEGLAALYVREIQTMAGTIERLTGALDRAQRVEAPQRAPRWVVRIEGASMLAPYLSDLGAAKADGHVCGAVAEAHDFGSYKAARAWLDAHPETGWVEEHREVRQGESVIFVRSWRHPFEPTDHVDVPLSEDSLGVPDLLLDFSIMVKDWLRTKDAALKADALALYERIVPSVPPTDPIRGSLDGLKDMLQ